MSVEREAKDAGRLVDRLGAEQILETHISWVLLLGEHAYKIKKPVSLGFVDFSDLEKRRHFCDVELELNRRFARDLYLAVVPITGDAMVPVFDGSGPVIEYALKMRRFDQDCLLSNMIEDGRLTPALVDSLAATIASLHAAAPVCRPQDASGAAQQQLAPVDECLQSIGALLPTGSEHDLARRALDRLAGWLDAHRAAFIDWIASRQRRGFQRDCHGDLHLGNVALIDGKVTAFDGLEFDPTLRRIDVIDDLAFAFMDLERHGRADLAWRLLDGYLERTGDIDGLVGLRLFIIHRALVRAKVALLRMPSSQAVSQDTTHDTRPERFVDDAVRYLQLAVQHVRQPYRFLAICSGLSGSGKSRLAQCLLEQCAAIRLRSDVERKRLAGLAPRDDSASATGAGLYTKDFTQRTYDRLAVSAAAALEAGFPVIVDATFLRFDDRQRFRGLAAQHAVPFHLIEVSADETVLRRRIIARQASGADPSDADQAVLDAQMQSRQPLRPEESAGFIGIDNSADGNGDALLERCAPVIQRLRTT